jgi:hypothetical protein
VPFVLVVTLVLVVTFVLGVSFVLGVVLCRGAGDEEGGRGEDEDGLF